jgi:ABC-type bacteriocin/lantibiotic exporter with double-glycine peptidase domain
MIKLNHVGQEPGLCGPPVLKMVLDYYGVLVPETKLARLAGASRKKGTSYHGLIKAAKHFDFQVFSKEKSSLDDLAYFIKRDIPVIVDWFLEDDGHYSVVVDINKRNLVLIDPSLTEEERRISAKKFLAIWFDFEGDFIKDSGDLILRLMLVIVPSGFSVPDGLPDGFRQH